MGLSKHARDEVDERIKVKFEAFFAGLKRGGFDGFADVYDAFVRYIAKRHPELSEYVECEMCHKWYEEEA